MTLDPTRSARQLAPFGLIGHGVVLAPRRRIRHWLARGALALGAVIGVLAVVGTTYYVAAWLLPLPVVAAIAALAALFGLAFVHADLSITMVLGSLVSALVLTPLFFGEEFGWRGYLQVRQRTGGIWAGCLAHSAADMTGSLSAYLFYGGGQWILTSYAGVLVWIPLGLVCGWIVLTSRRTTARDLVIRDEARSVA